MKSILFIHSHTLYIKATLPIAFEFIKKGYKVFFKSNNIFENINNEDKLLKIIKKNPINVKVVNKCSLNYIAKILDLENEWIKYNKSIFIENFFSFNKFDIIIGTVKDLFILKKYSEKKIHTIALGYQHIPVFINLGKKQFNDYHKNFFLEQNDFTKFHDFKNIFKNYLVKQSGFTYLDHVYNKKIKVNKHLNNILIFHPGGYRNIISNYGDNKELSYKAQRDFIEKICIPLIKKNYKPVIKIHPLSAMFHDYNDIKIIINDVVNQHNLNLEDFKIIPRDKSYWNYAFNSKFILTFGSSSLYELWSVGLKNVFVCNFLGDSRSKKFNFFDSIFINNYDEYQKLIRDFNNENYSLDKFSNLVFNSYFSLYNGKSIETLMNFINEK